MNYRKNKTKATSTYSKKVSGLIYEPQGDCPSLEQMVDISKTKELIQEIQEAKDISDQDRRLFDKQIWGYKLDDVEIALVNDSMKVDAAISK